MSPVLTDLWVSSIRVGLQRKGPNYEAKAFVTVVGESFSLIREAVVTGSWALNGSYLNEASGTTSGKGMAKLNSEKGKAKPGDTFTVTVSRVIKDGYTYDSASNTVTTDSVTVPKKNTESRLYLEANT